MRQCWKQSIQLPTLNSDINTVTSKFGNVIESKSIIIILFRAHFPQQRVRKKTFNQIDNITVKINY